MLAVFSVKMCWAVLAGFYAFAIFSHSDASLELPSFINKTCKRTDPQLSKCWRSSFESLRPYLQQGIPNFNIPPLDNWLIPAKIDFIEKTFVAEVQNVTYKAADKVEILDNSISLQENTLTLKLRYSKLSYDFAAAINGSIFNFKFDRSGKAEGITDDLVIDYKLKGRRFVHNGDDIITFYNTKVELEFGKYAITSMDVLKTAEENEKFLVEFSKNLANFKPLLKKIHTETIGVAILETLKYVYGRYPLDVLHPFE